jgi:hypothetical protein
VVIFKRLHTPFLSPSRSPSATFVRVDAAILFPRCILHNTPRTFTSANLRFPILFGTISWPSPPGTDSLSSLPVSAVNPSNFVPIPFSSHPVFPFSFHHFHLLVPLAPELPLLADPVLGTSSLHMDISRLFPADYISTPSPPRLL